MGFGGFILESVKHSLTQGHISFKIKVILIVDKLHWIARSYESNQKLYYDKTSNWLIDRSVFLKRIMIYGLYLETLINSYFLAREQEIRYSATYITKLHIQGVFDLIHMVCLMYRVPYGNNK